MEHIPSHCKDCFKSDIPAILGKVRNLTLLGSDQHILVCLMSEHFLQYVMMSNERKVEYIPGNVEIH